MPAVAEYGPLKSTLRPINQQGITVQASPEAMGAGIGRGLQAFAAGIGEAGRAMELVQRIDDENTVKRRLVDKSLADREAMYGENGYALKQGEAAVSGRSEAEKIIAENTKKFSQGLTPAQQRLYDEKAMLQDASTGASIIQHQGTERKSATIQTSKSLVDTYGQDAIAGYSDPRIRDEALTKGHAEIASLGGLMGWSPETIAQQQKAFSSKTLRGVTMRMAEDDPVAAQKFADDHADQIEGEDQAYIKSTLKSGILNEQSKREADRIMTESAGQSGDYYKIMIGKESGGNPNARNPDSSATGLGQFTTKTWEALMLAHPELGLTADGRTDPDQSMRAIKAFTEDNERALKANGIEINNANRYMAHFLGVGGAVKLIRAMQADPTQSAAALMPAAAEANRAIFYDRRTGGARSVSEVYAIQTRRFGGGSSLGEPVSVYGDRAQRLMAITDPDVRELTMKRLAAMDKLIADQQAAQSAAFKQQLWAVIDGGGTPDDVSPEVRAGVGMEGVSSAWSYIAARDKRGDVQSDEDLLYKYRREAAEDPQAFANRNLLDDRDKLSKEAIKELTGLQQAAIGDARKAKDDGVTLTTAYGLAETQLKSVGIGIKTRATDGDQAYMDDQRQIARFNNALTDEITQFKSLNKKNPTQVEMQQMINRLLMPAIIQRNNENDYSSMNPGDWFGGNSITQRPGFMFEGRTATPGEVVRPNITINDIPRPYRQSLTEVLMRANGGRQPSEQEILDAYIEMQVDPYGG